MARFGCVSGFLGRALPPCEWVRCLRLGPGRASAPDGDASSQLGEELAEDEGHNMCFPLIHAAARNCAPSIAPFGLGYTAARSWGLILGSE
jgi:hypothetical protein